MPSKQDTAQDQEASTALSNAVEKTLSTVSVTTSPVVIVGVNRRATTGHYEHLDIYAGVALPLLDVDTTDSQALSVAIQEAAEIGFRETSRETFERYKLIKDSGRSKPEEEEST